MKLSILMPAYNEERWIEDIVKRVLTQEVPGVDERELVIVDDCSTDRTREIIDKLRKEHPQIVFVAHEKNAGKGAGLRTAIESMSGDICIIQDADWEYDPADYPIMLEPLIQGRADCVFGSRFMGSKSKRVLFFWHYVGNKFLTLLSNMFTNLNLTDMETCYKAFKCDALKSVPIRCQRFGFEPEITAKIAKRRFRIYEVGISYSGRTYEDGKKITWRDGIMALYYVLKFWLIDDSIKK